MDLWGQVSFDPVASAPALGLGSLPAIPEGLPASATAVPMSVPETSPASTGALDTLFAADSLSGAAWATLPL